MIAKTVTILLIVGIAFAHKPFSGVDPNTVSCDPEGQVYLLLPDFHDCSKFFMCANGQEVPFACNGGLIFDFELQGCNWKSDARCILRTPKEDAEEGSGDEGSGDEGSGDEGSGDDIEWQLLPEKSIDIQELPTSNHLDSQHFGQKVIDCKNADDAAKHVSYKGDCQRFWSCENGLPHVMYCSDGLFFNERTQQCDFEANVRCLVELEDELTGEYILN